LADIKAMTLRQRVLSTSFHTSKPTGMTTGELEGHKWCSFRAKNGLPNNCKEDNGIYFKDGSFFTDFP